MKGYKVTNPDGTCKGHLFEVGETYELEGAPVICERGFHFCEKPADCFNYYDFEPENRVFEVKATGEIDHNNGDKHCTNKIAILRELQWAEVLQLVNTGDRNTGNRNTGNRNTGNRNTGDRNTGNRNTGDMNTGDMNTGDMNTGDMNTGDRNTGDRNTGNRNTGDMNTGDWNAANNCAGVFCPAEHKPKIPMFGKPSDWTLEDWRESRAAQVSRKMMLTKWVSSDEMSEAEKAENPTHEATGGYLLKKDYKDACLEWWARLDDAEKQCFFDLPNFDAEAFEQITGIKTN